MTRTRPRPAPVDGAYHLIGDTQFGIASMTPWRKQIWAEDMERLHPTLNLAAHLQMGDVTENVGGASAGYTAPGYFGQEDAEALAYFNAHLNTAPWYAAVGNHDIGQGPTYSRPPDKAAEAWGMPAANYVVDTPAARLIFICPDDGLVVIDGYGHASPFTEARLNWIATQASGAGSKPVVLICHWSLAYTVNGIGLPGQHSTNNAFFQAKVDGEIRTMLADVPQIKGWLSGHTHSPLDAPSLVTPLAVGGHTIAAVNASATCYTGTSGSFPFSKIATLYMTVLDDQLDFRFRDHGAGLWVAAGPEQDKRVWSVTI